MRRTLLMVLLALVVGATVVPVAVASPLEDILALAQYFPAETPVLIGFRTDDAVIEELDALVARIAEGLPPGTVPPFSLEALLDAGIAEAFGSDATFENTIRPWLGDTAAVGVLSLEETFGMGMMGQSMGSGAALQTATDAPALIAVSVRDREAAEAFMKDLIPESGGMTVRRNNPAGFTVYIPRQTTDGMIIAIGDDVALITNQEDLPALTGDFQSLGDNPDFAATAALLPETLYNAVALLNVGDTFSQMFQTMLDAGMMPAESMDMFEMLMPIYENFPMQAVGLTLLDERSLTIDFAQTAFDYSMLGDALGGIVPPTSFEPVDLSFTENIPADAPFFIQGTQFGTLLDYALDAFGVAFEIGIQQATAMPGASAEIPPFVRNIDAAQFRAFVELAFAGFTGLNLTEDVIPYLNGNSAVFGRVLPAGEDEDNFTVDTAVVIEVTDAAAMQSIYDELLGSLEAYEAEFTEEDGVIVLPGLIRGFFPPEFPKATLEAPEYDFLIGLSDDVFAFGSRPAVEFALDAAGESIADDPNFVTAQQFLLPDAETIGYLNMDAVSELAQGMLAMFPDAAGSMGEAEQALMLLDLFDSASVSSVLNDDGSALSRLVVTLAE